MNVLGKVKSAASPAPLAEAEIDERLSRPTEASIRAAAASNGSFVVLGAGGKMGLTMAALIRRSLDAAGKASTPVTAIARFSSRARIDDLAAFGIGIQRCDFRDPGAVDALPDAANAFFLSGQKFGTDSAPEETWIQNVVVPYQVARRYRDARTVVFSTGCVYPLSPIDGPGAPESAHPGFLGEYASTCVGRERTFSHVSREFGTPVVLFRLNYSVEYRYGILVDLAQRVWNGEPVDVSMPAVNVIWQRDACSRAMEALPLASSPPFALNVTGEKLAVRDLATAFAERFGRPARFVGTPGPTAWHIDPSLSFRHFGRPSTSLPEMIDAVADHIVAGGRLLGKPTHFEVRDGKF